MTGNPFSRRRRYVTARERVARRRGTSGGAYTRHRTRARRSLVPCAFLFMLGLLVAGGLALFLFSQATRTLASLEQRDPRRAQQAGDASGAQLAALPDTLRTPFTVLLIGVDRRSDPTEGVRGDTLIVVHVNPAGRWASMLSIPRDSVVQIPRFGQQKINAAYALGYLNSSEIYGADSDPAASGGALAAETVENFLGLRIDYIAQVDFRGFQRIVDTMGGVVIDVPRPLLDAEYPTDNYGYERIYIPAGLQVLDGRTVLAYARSRHSGSDFDRSRRQQQVLQAMLTSIKQRNLLDQVALLPDLAQDLQESITTTLPLSDLNTLRGLAALARDLPQERIVRLSLNPNDVGMTEYGSDIHWDPADVQVMVTRMLAGP